MNGRRAEPRLPLCTATTIALCVGLQAYRFLFEPPLNQFTLSGLFVIYGHQYWRLVTSALFHGGFVHILFNMMSMAAIGSSLEHSIGTVQLFFSVAWLIILCSCFSVAVSWFLTMVVFYDPAYLKQQSVGFSGVIFALCVVDIYKSSSSTRSLFGFVEVPARVYPWALLVALQVLVPNVSFLGHLSGVLVGTLQAHGALNCLLPSLEATKWMETHLAAGGNQCAAFSACAAGRGSNSGGGAETWWRLFAVGERFVHCPDEACSSRENLLDLL